MYKLSTETEKLYRIGQKNRRCLNEDIDEMVYCTEEMERKANSET